MAISSRGEEGELKIAAKMLPSTAEFKGYVEARAEEAKSTSFAKREQPSAGRSTQSFSSR